MLLSGKHTKALSRKNKSEMCFLYRVLSVLSLCPFCAVVQKYNLPFITIRRK